MTQLEMIAIIVIYTVCLPVAVWAITEARRQRRQEDFLSRLNNRTRFYDAETELTLHSDAPEYWLN
jgi:hypothetical protein